MMSPSPSVGKSTKHQRPTFLISVTGDEVDSSPVSSSSPSTDAPKSQCSSLSEGDGESFECYGENEILDGGGVDLELTPHVSSNHTGEEHAISRHTWSRSSLRRAPKSNQDANSIRRWGSMRHSGRRQLGSNALASHLYRSASFNSSGRSSNCDNTEDMYSDVSLDDVQDLNHKLELLQRQVTNLADSQNNVEDITTRTKTEYAVLQARYHMLEEQLRECEMRAEERIAEEQRRNRELLARMEREAQLQTENCQIKVRTVEKEATALQEEAHRLRIQCDKQAADLHATEEKLEITKDNYTALQQEVLELQAREKKLLAEKVATEELMLEMSREVDRLRSERGPAMPTTSPESIRLEELHQELDELRQVNKNLEEANEELQALVLTRGVEEGRNLLNGTSNSLAQELHDMSQSQDGTDAAMLTSLTQLQTAYQDKEEENVRLKHYIDTILLNIVENYPQLLEVKSNSVSNAGN
ncbi:rab11 family-interacting protein 3 isoform X3 [Lutzomyia longipalpis]|nr:rab11 family-interacting protein 3 isoform X3 [Lutzomyia longipalpis]XP_055691809.1 rab11 family-interacting protein 3 isoform X3 [Lutzomyia longipalpis]XP_055691811.1 rab11 family-interacting protein 3 isoform X3 [Lutzomyia longipalpis]